MRRRHRDRGVPAGPRPAPRPAHVDRATALADRQQAADERRAPCCGRRRRPARCATSDAVRRPAPRRGPAACGSWSPPRAACRTTRSRARPGAGRRRAFISRRGRAVAARPARGGGQRVDQRGPVGHPVGVAAPQRREAGVEPAGGLDHAAYAHVGGQDAVEPAQQASAAAPSALRAACRRGRACTTWPRACTPVSVRPAQTTDDLRQPQHRGQRRLQLALHGPQPRLGRPAVEVGAVVGEVDPDPHPGILSPAPGGADRARLGWRCERPTPSTSSSGLRAPRRRPARRVRRRYARDYDVRAGAAPAARPRSSPSELAGRGAAGGPVRQPTPGCPTPARCSRPSHRCRDGGADRPAADRGALGPLPRGRPDGCAPGLAKGKYDAYLLMPRGKRDEEFHNAITELLSDWGSTVAAPEVDQRASIVSPVRDALTLAIRDFLDRMGMPNRRLRPRLRPRARVPRRRSRSEPDVPARRRRSTARVDPGRRRSATWRDRDLRRARGHRHRRGRRPRGRRRRAGRPRGGGLRRVRGAVDRRARGGGGRRPGRHQLDDPQLPRLPARHLRHAAGPAGPQPGDPLRHPVLHRLGGRRARARRGRRRRTCCAPTAATCAPARSWSRAASPTASSACPPLEELVGIGVYYGAR